MFKIELLTVWPSHELCLQDAVKTSFLSHLYVPSTPVIRNCTNHFIWQCLYKKIMIKCTMLLLWYSFYMQWKTPLFSLLSLSKLFLRNTSVAIDLYLMYHTSDFRWSFSIGKHWYQVGGSTWRVVWVTVFADPHLVARVQVLERISGNSLITIGLMPL